MLRQLRASREGSVSVIAPIAALTMLIGIATSANLAVVVNTHTQLQNFADAASLKAAQAANDSLVTQASTSPAEALQTAQAAAETSVATNAAAAGITTLPGISVSYASQTQYSGSVTVTLTSTPKFFLPNLVPGLSGPVTVTSTASMTATNSYIQVIFLVDVSNSMTVGGSTAAIQALENTNSQCAFACHDPNAYYYSANGVSCTTSLSPQTYSRKGKPVCDMRAYAQANGIELKIDYVKQAMQTFTSQLNDYAASNNTYISVGISTFGTNVIQSLAPTTDIAAAITAASAVDVENATQYFNSHNSSSYRPLDYADYNGGYTKTTDALNYTASQLTNVGDGSSATKRKTYIIFLSDGAEDVYDATYPPYYHNIDVTYTNACTTLKNMGVQLFSIWVPYYSVPGNSLFDTYVAPVTGTGSGTMQGSMQSCASKSDDYFQADDGAGIQSAFSSALNMIINDSSLRISK
ncbi:VWA domain-containing protein [Acetobacter musti]|uniref:VWA domain-containing protein n=1 Tax=Acetobacter musti TaxID=864732 RepID=A0ABX0JSG1_9PROT|nr:vWA domain-containing protein [Acetobacter musti]NHN85752.1 VWA domain-containing protein [Acetobacter musti]